MAGDLLHGQAIGASAGGQVAGRRRGNHRDVVPEQAECLVLRFMQGMSLAETALVIGKSEGAVKQLQLRAVRALHRQLGGESP